MTGTTNCDANIYLQHLLGTQYFSASKKSTWFEENVGGKPILKSWIFLVTIKGYNISFQKFLILGIESYFHWHIEFFPAWLFRMTFRTSILLRKTKMYHCSWNIVLGMRYISNLFQLNFVQTTTPLSLMFSKKLTNILALFCTGQKPFSHKFQSSPTVN